MLIVFKDEADTIIYKNTVRRGYDWILVADIEAVLEQRNCNTTSMTTNITNRLLRGTATQPQWQYKITN